MQNEQITNAGEAAAQMTTDEINDAIAEQVEREMPTPRGGFGSADEEDEHCRKHVARFMDLVRNPESWNF